MKPTVGLISRSGIVPIAASQDTAGALSLRPQDLATQAIPTDFDYDLAAATSNRSLRGKKFGLLSSGSDIPAANTLFAIHNHYGKGARGEVTLPQRYLILLYEFKLGLEVYLASASESKKTLQSLIDFNNKNETTVMPHFGQEIFHQALAVQHEYEAYADAKRIIAEIRDETIALIDANDFDGFIGLTRGPAWLTEYSGGDAVAMKNLQRHFADVVSC